MAGFSDASRSPRTAEQGRPTERPPKTGGRSTEHPYRTRAAGHQHRSPWPVNNTHDHLEVKSIRPRVVRKEECALPKYNPTRPSPGPSRPIASAGAPGRLSSLLGVPTNRAVVECCGCSFPAWGCRTVATHRVSWRPGPSFSLPRGHPPRIKTAGRHDRCPPANPDQMQRSVRTGLHSVGTLAV
jgi:hypothetical protein